MAKIFNKKNWKSNVQGFTIFDCTLNRPQSLCFLLVEEKENRDVYPRTRFLFVYPDEPMEDRFGYLESGDFSFSTIARNINPPEYVAVDSRSLVYSADGDRDGVERPIEQIVDMNLPDGSMATIRRVGRVAGHLYAVGSDRKIYRRDGFEKWVDLHTEKKGVPLPKDFATTSADWSSRIGFKDLSAFNENDMYAVGGYGDVWRFDGKQWHQCPFPTNTDLETVCCAGDGKVYITDLHGAVWAGRENKWEKLADGELAWGYQPKDAFWFKGRMYFGAQEGVYTLEKKKLLLLQETQENAPSSMVSGRLDVSPDGEYLLTAGPYGACLFDGEQWTQLFSAYDFI